MGRADDLAGAVQKATEVAKKNMKFYLRLDNRTIYSDVDFKYHASVLKLKSARPGIGFLSNRYSWG
jgi:small subunit ribosomal protein S5